MMSVWSEIITAIVFILLASFVLFYPAWMALFLRLLS